MSQNSEQDLYHSPSETFSIFDEFEQICHRHPSFASFASSPADVKKYFKLAQGFFGEANFSAVDFEILLEQIKSVCDHDAEIATRIWRTTKREIDFSVEIEEDYGRDLNQLEWNEYVKELKNSYLSELQSAYPLDQMDQVIAETQKVLQEILQTRSETLARLQSEDELKFYFINERQRTDLNALTSGLLYFTFTSREIESFLATVGASDVINFFTDLTAPGKRLRYHLSEEQYKIIHPIIKQKVPTKSQLKAMKNIFPPTLSKVAHGAKEISLDHLKAGIYQFKTSPRPLHSIFLNLSTGDCTLRSSEEGCPTPLRWVTYLYDTAVSYCFSRGKNFYGSLSIIPFVSDQKNWGCIEPSSARLNRRVTVQTTDGKKSGYFFDFVILQILHHAKDLWHGLTISNFSNLDNYGTVELFNQRSAGRFARVITTPITLGAHSEMTERLIARHEISTYISRQSALPVMSPRLHGSLIKEIDPELFDQASNFERISSVSSKCKLFSDFLEQKGVQSDYFQLCQSVYGPQAFHDDDFLSMRFNLARFVESYPLLDQELWQTLPLGKPFQLELRSTTPSEGLRSPEETDTLQLLLLDLVHAAGPIFRAGNKWITLTQIRKIIALQTKRRKNLERFKKTARQSIERLQRHEKKLQTFEDTFATRAAAALAYIFFSSHAWREFFKYAPAHQLRSFMNRPDCEAFSILPIVSPTNRGKIDAAYKIWIDRFRAISLTDTPSANSKVSVVQFKPIHKFIDRVFMGISRPSFQNKFGEANASLIERWGLDTTGLCFAIFVDEKYLGSLRIYPYTDKSGNTWGDVHLESNWFLQSSSSSIDSFLQNRPNFEWILPELEKQIPESWLGLTTAVSIQVDDFGAGALIAESDFAQMSPRAQNPDRYQINTLLKSIFTLRYLDDKNSSRLFALYGHFLEKNIQILRRPPANITPMVQLDDLATLAPTLPELLSRPRLLEALIQHWTDFGQLSSRQRKKLKFFFDFLQQTPEIVNILSPEYSQTIKPFFKDSKPVTLQGDLLAELDPKVLFQSHQALVLDTRMQISKLLRIAVSDIKISDLHRNALMEEFQNPANQKNLALLLIGIEVLGYQFRDLLPCYSKASLKTQLRRLLGSAHLNAKKYHLNPGILDESWKNHFELLITGATHSIKTGPVLLQTDVTIELRTFATLLQNLLCAVVDGDLDPKRTSTQTLVCRLATLIFSSHQRISLIYKGHYRGSIQIISLNDRMKKSPQGPASSEALGFEFISRFAGLLIRDKQGITSSVAERILNLLGKDHSAFIGAGHQFDPYFINTTLHTNYNRKDSSWIIPSHRLQLADPKASRFIVQARRQPGLSLTATTVTPEWSGTKTGAVQIIDHTKTSSVKR